MTHETERKTKRVSRMWANAQRDGRPAEYGSRPLFNAAKFDWCPILECSAVRWNLLGCPKFANRSQPLVGRSSPYWGHVGKTLLFNKFFQIVDICLSCEDIARQSCAMVRRWRLLAWFLRPVFPASRVQHISDMHCKFALRPHHEWKYGRHPNDPISDRWD